MSNSIILPEEVLIKKIYILREQKIMLDRDLAELFGVKSIRLREQVKRNTTRFPSNFMFELTQEEVELMVSHFAIPSKQVLGGSLPFAFTEHGILMLSNVLKNERATQMSIRIIELFIELRKVVILHRDLALLVEQVERRMLKQDEKIDVLLAYLKKFIDKKREKVTPIGFRQGNYKEQSNDN